MYRNHRDLASDLQILGQQKHWLVSLEGASAIRLSKEFHGQVISCLLLKGDNKTYDLQPITYSFKCKTSFFDYSTPENRFARNQIFFLSLFRFLRDANALDLIANRNQFLVVNDSNTSIGDRQKEMKARLKALLLDAQLVRTRSHETTKPIEKTVRFRKSA